MLVTALSGLNTRKALKALMEEPLDEPPIKVCSIVIQAEPTITKSRQFQGSLKYAFLFRTKPSPTIFNSISVEYRNRKIFSVISDSFVVYYWVGSKVAKK
jgi:hypothetical protein